MRIVWGLFALAVMAFLAWLVFAPGEEELATRKPEPAPAMPTQKPAPAESVTPSGQDPAKRQLLAHEKAEAERLAALARQEEATKAPPETKLYYRVTVRDGGTLEAGDIVITLDAIKSREVEAQCEDATGKSWPCGMAARAALARLIRSRAISCTLPKGGEQPSFASRCSVADTDLSAWMVRHGWAEAKAPAAPDLAKAAEEARRERIGFWRAAE